MNAFDQEIELLSSRETAGDQFRKLAAEIDTANFMNKKNPVTGHSGVDAASVEEGLAAVLARKGKRSFDDTIPKERKEFTPRYDEMPIITPALGAPLAGNPKGSAVVKTALEMEKKAWFHLKREGDVQRQRLTMVRDRISAPDWDREVGRKKMDHFNNFLAMAEQRKGKALTKEEVDILITSYNKATGTSVPLTEDWHGGSVPYEAFEGSKTKTAGGILRPFDPSFLKKLGEEAERATEFHIPTKFTPKQKAGLIAGGALTAGTGLGLGALGVHRAARAEKDVRDLSKKTIAALGTAGSDVSKEVMRVGGAMAGGADSLREASENVNKVVKPIADTVEKVQGGKKAIVDAVEKTLAKAPQAQKVVADTARSGGRVIANAAHGGKQAIVDAVHSGGKAVISKAHSGRKVVSNVARGGKQAVVNTAQAAKAGTGKALFRVLSRIAKYSHDTNSRDMYIKLASAGQLRTLEGWNQ